MAEVLAVGPGGMVDGKEVVMNVKPGDKVIYSKYAGTEVKIDGQEITAAAEPARNVIDLMEALQKSLEMQAGRREPALAGAV